jgi:hypothetical protein
MESRKKKEVLKDRSVFGGVWGKGGDEGKRVLFFFYLGAFILNRFAHKLDNTNKYVQKSTAFY